MKLVELTAPRGEAKAQLSEAKIATSLQHPNVVRSSDIPIQDSHSCNPVWGILWRVVVGTQGNTVSNYTAFLIVHKAHTCVELHLCRLYTRKR